MISVIISISEIYFIAKRKTYNPFCPVIIIYYEDFITGMNVCEIVYLIILVKIRPVQA